MQKRHEQTQSNARRHRNPATHVAHLIFLAALSLTAGSLQAADVSLPTASPVPGGVAIVDLQYHAGKAAPEVRFGKRAALALQHGDNWQAVIGIPLLTEPGEQSITATFPGLGSRTYTFQVQNKDYPEQHLTIENKRKVNPVATDMERIKSERTIIANAKRYRHPEILSTRFTQPVDGIRSSSFGSRRFLNGQARRPHGGLDIAAAEGTTVVAPGNCLLYTSPSPRDS